MKNILVVVFLLFTINSFGQELGFIINGKHSIKLVRNTTNYSLSYSDVKSGENNLFLFPKVESVKNIILDGFKSSKDHLVIVKTTNDTIIKFEFKRLNGVPMVKIKQNNLLTESFGSSIFFSKDEIVALFENQSI